MYFTLIVKFIRSRLLVQTRLVDTRHFFSRVGGPYGNKGVEPRVLFLSAPSSKRDRGGETRRIPNRPRSGATRSVTARPDIGIRYFNMARNPVIQE